MKLIYYCILFSTLAALTIIFPSILGIADLFPFIFWSIPFAIAISFFSKLLFRFFENHSIIIKVTLPAILSLAIAYLWSLVTYKILGIWILAFSLPLFPSWAIGGYAAMISSLFHDLSEKLKVMILISGMILLAFITNITPKPDNLIITFVEWQEANSYLLIDKHSILSSQEGKAIRNLNENGSFVVLHRSNHGLLPQTRMIVIVYSHLQAKVELPLPRRGRVVYLIDKSGNFRYFPDDSVFYDRNLLLEIFSDSNTNSDYMIQLPYGAMVGGTAFNWDK